LAFHSGREADHSPLSSAEVKEWVELYLRSPTTPSWRGAQLGGAQGHLYLYHCFSTFQYVVHVHFHVVNTRIHDTASGFVVLVMNILLH
jgi:hypothetical protein